MSPLFSYHRKAYRFLYDMKTIRIVLQLGDLYEKKDNHSKLSTEM